MQTTLLIKYQPPVIQFDIRTVTPSTLQYTTGFSPPVLLQNIPLLRHVELFIARKDPSGSKAPIKDDLRDYIDLLAAYCAEGSISKIVEAVKIIHTRLQWESAPVVAGWVRYLRGLHPIVDKQISSLPLFNVTPSDVMGNNTYTYARGAGEVDITQQKIDTLHDTNKVYWYDQQNSVTHVKDSVRVKLPAGVAAIINEAGNAAAKTTANSYIYDAYAAHTPTGGESIQVRPIQGIQAHGSSISQDITYGSVRIYGANKVWGFQNSIAHLHRGGYFGHMLNHSLSPISNTSPALKTTFTVSSSVGITKEFWIKGTDMSRPYVVSTSNQVNVNTPQQVTDHALIPIPPTELDA